jgi:hypothetical protein
MSTATGVQDQEHRFPAWPVIEVRVAHDVRTSDVTATLELPDGGRQQISAGTLEQARDQVRDAVRDYLRTKVRHSGRMHVVDPDGDWLLGVPLGDEPFVHISGHAHRTIAAPASAPASERVSRPPAPRRRSRRVPRWRPASVALLIVTAAGTAAAIASTGGTTAPTISAKRAPARTATLTTPAAAATAPTKAATTAHTKAATTAHTKAATTAHTKAATKPARERLAALRRKSHRRHVTHSAAATKPSSAGSSTPATTTSPSPTYTPASSSVPPASTHTAPTSTASGSSTPSAKRSSSSGASDRKRSNLPVPGGPPPL